MIECLVFSAVFARCSNLSDLRELAFVKKLSKTFYSSKKSSGRLARENDSRPVVSDTLLAVNSRNLFSVSIETE